MEPKQTKPNWWNWIQATDWGSGMSACCKLCVRSLFYFVDV